MTLGEHLANTFRTESGQETLKWLLEITGADSSGFGQDAQLNAYNCGRRSIGAAVLCELRSCEEGLELEKELRRELIYNQIGDD